MEVTNAEFAGFLNDALAHLADDRGAYMYFDVDSGDVYLAPTSTGEVGTAGSGTLLFDASVNLDRIVYDLQAQQYRIPDGAHADHPTAGVTWFGALKYCNWLTLSRKLPAAQRAYAESAAAAEWRPVTIALADWQSRDLSAAERDALLQRFGYRLPMDGGTDGASPGVYNEWYKAAAWDGAAGANHVYGFGRDTLSGTDANYRDSGDPFDNSTTPAGYYDGTDHDGLFQTTADMNAYGLRDASGNLWEWMQDKDVSQTQRRNRGGGFLSARSALETARAAARSADSASGSTGIRIAQSVPASLFIAPQADLENSGIWGGPYELQQTTFDCTVFNFSAAPVDFTAAVDRTWVVVDPAGGQIAEDAAAAVTVRLDPHCTDGLIVGENVARITFTNQKDGATHDRLVRLTLREPLALSPPEDFSATAVMGRLPEAREQAYTLDNASDLPVQASAQWVETAGDSGGVKWLTLNGGDQASLELDAHGQAALLVAVGDDAASLPTGLFQATVTVADACTGSEFTRSVQLEVTAPFSISPEGESVSTGNPGGPFTPGEHAFTFTNLIDGSIEWTALLDPPETAWLELDATAGTLADKDETATITARIAAAANDLPSGRHGVTLIWGESGSTFTQSREIFIDVDGLRIEPVEAFESSGTEGGPFKPASQTYTLFNPGFEEWYWSVTFEDTSDPPAGSAWIEFDAADGVILDPEGTQEVTTRFNAQTEQLAPGTYTGVINFQGDWVPSVQRSVILTLSRPSMSVEPGTAWEAGGRPGGPIHFRSRVFTVKNPPESRGPIDWSAAQADPGVDWLRIDGGLSAGGTLQPGERTTVVVEIDSASTLGLDIGTPLEAAILFSDLTAGQTFERTLTLTLSTPLFDVQERLVDPASRQRNGPLHAFVAGRTHVTNAEFASFLNDARANKTHERGQYLYHDLDSGDVFIHSEVEGTEGSDGGGVEIYRRINNSAQVGRIFFDGVRYAVDPGFEDHPVTAVSWFGALKFCNWLTLDQGLPADQRCYAEAASGNVDGWHPVTISDADWIVRDLTDGEQQQLIRDTLGFRLPFDDGADRDCSSAGSDNARLYNEWYAAAAWNPGLGINTKYGFGRDAIDGMDANYKASGDPYEANLISTTPVARFDGLDHGDGFLPRADANAFGLFDMSGNAYQWLTNRYCIDRLNSRTLRGGAHDSPKSGSDVPLLKTTARTFASPGFVGPQVGFRVLRATAHRDGDADADGDVDLDDWTPITGWLEGPGQPAGFDAAAGDLDADGDVDLRDAALVLARFRS
ncbi:MAG: SUMF1/EgtB/PvdO family nonheme iron enzyme [Phycisphaerales bacterium]|nr:SUMF1/EgtB/PvdO family nonheme iron enzyme [Phycisphaerales bacterium]